MTTTAESINTNVKNELLQAIRNEEAFFSILTRLTAKELKQVLDFFWDFLIDQSQKATTKLHQTDLLQKLEPLSKYQQRVKCQEPLGYCTISMCVRVSPDCAIERITGIFKSLIPFLQTLANEKPECLSIKLDEPEEETTGIQAETFTPEPILSEPNGSDQEILRQPEEHSKQTEAISEDMPSSTESENNASQMPLSEKYAKYKDQLWSMVEFEGLDHAFLQTREGQVLQFASSSRSDYENIADKISAEIESVIEQGEAANYQNLLTVTKEYSQGVMAIRAIADDIYLVGVSETVLPGKIHSLIVKLGNMLQTEMK